MEMKQEKGINYGIKKWIKGAENPQINSWLRLFGLFHNAKLRWPIDVCTKAFNILILTYLQSAQIAFGQPMRFMRVGINHASAAPDICLDTECKAITVLNDVGFATDSRGTHSLATSPLAYTSFCLSRFWCNTRNSDCPEQRWARKK